MIYRKKSGFQRIISLSEILTRAMLEEVSGSSSNESLDPVWTVRYQVHLKCRGVLTVKGYLVGAQ